MKPLLPLASLALVLAVSCQSTSEAVQSSAAEASVPRDEGFPRADVVRRLNGDVAWLADDARDGRRAGTKGEWDSARWILRRFEALGLEPAGSDLYFQGFGVDLPAHDGGGSFVRVDGERHDAVPLFCSSADTVSGRLVDAGYGIVFEERERDDYAGLDCEGAVVLIRRGAPEAPGEEEATEPAEENPHGGASGSSAWGGTTAIFHKVMQAKRRGAAAVVLGPRDADEALLRFDSGQTARAGIPAVQVSWEDHARLREGAAGKSLDVFADVVRETGSATNVLARIPGADPARTVVIGAHYDHLGRGGIGSLAKDSIDEIHNGADDNASGVAVVLEVARQLTKGPQPEGDVLVALWSAEELGLLGSDHWAENPTVPLANVRANLNLDMVGRADGGKLQVLGGGTAAPFAAWLEEEGPASELELTVSSSGQGLGGSDHQTFLKRQIPALHFFSGVHTDYHKPSDDAVRFEADGAARVADLTVAMVRRIQDADELAYVEPEVEEGPAGRRAGGFRTRFGSIPDYAYEGKGMRLSGTSAGGPAERAGLLAGDVLVELDDIEIEGIYDFMFALNAHKPGDVVLVKYLRDGTEESVRLTLDSPDLE